MMNMESQNNWMLRRTLLARWCVSLALLSATASPALASQGTRAQRIACTPDALRLCSAFIPNADEITTCLREKNAELSDACRTAFEAAMNQPPGVSDGTATRKPEDKDR
jgi:predicted GNAT superfamily acetyltransferase